MDKYDRGVKMVNGIDLRYAYHVAVQVFRADQRSSGRGGASRNATAGRRLDEFLAVSTRP
jgi:hypothetical protein